jgi:hypothetical protein
MSTFKTIICHPRSLGNTFNMPKVKNDIPKTQDSPRYAKNTGS